MVEPRAGFGASVDSHWVDYCVYWLCAVPSKSLKISLLSGKFTLALRLRNRMASLSNALAARSSDLKLPRYKYFPVSMRTWRQMLCIYFGHGLQQRCNGQQSIMEAARQMRLVRNSYQSATFCHTAHSSGRECRAGWRQGAIIICVFTIYYIYIWQYI